MEKTYYGNPISQYGLEQGYVDYACFTKAFQHVLCNNITEIDEYLFDNIVSGDCYYEIYYDTLNNCEISKEEYEACEEPAQIEIEEHYAEIFQYYIVSANAVDILKENNEIVFYSDKLDVYVWGVTHWGTSWDYVLTNIKIDNEEENK